MQNMVFSLYVPAGNYMYKVSISIVSIVNFELVKAGLDWNTTKIHNFENRAQNE